MIRNFLHILVAGQFVSGLMAAEFKSGFELGPVGDPTGWKIVDDGMSTVTLEQKLGGRRSLKIVDADGRERGSSAWSSPILLKPRQDVRLSLWCYLEKGDTRGLGIYIDFQDAAGKSIGDRIGYRQTLEQGRWNLMIASQRPPAGAVQARAWLHTINNAVISCYVDNVTLETIPPEGPLTVSGWSRATLDDVNHRTWPAGVRWEHRKTDGIDRHFAESQDFSRYKSFSFNVYSERKTGSSFVIIFASENPQTEGPDYYSLKIPIDFQGWKEYRLPLSELRAARSPSGWHQIDSVKLRASGFGQTLDPTATIVIDGLRLMP